VTGGAGGMGLGGGASPGGLGLGGGWGEGGAGLGGGWGEGGAGLGGGFVPAPGGEGGGGDSVGEPPSPLIADASGPTLAARLAAALPGGE
jgi:hypothetical protein